jgi:hypothetical protein
MRDRLIELIGNKPFTSEYENYNSVEWAEHCADYLLENGVIVPPCKVGDVVYVVDYTRLGNMIFECTIEEISHFTHGTYYYLNWGLHIPRFKACQENSIGKTVFLTKEEAEQALKGGEG